MFQVGQEVAIRTGYGYHSYRVGTVAKVTPSGQVVLAEGWRFDRHGDEVSSSSRRAHIEPLTDVIRAGIRHDQLLSQLSGTRWRDLPLSTLERVAAALEARDDS